LSIVSKNCFEKLLSRLNANTPSLITNKPSLVKDDQVSYHM